MPGGAPTVLLVFAHPDDESFGPGATLAALARRGVRLVLVTLTRGERSTLGVELVRGPEELAALRERELQQAARELGIAEVRQYAYPDGGLLQAPRDELKQLLSSALRELRPVVVITFGRGGLSGHPDHIAVARLAAETAAQQEAPRPAVYGWTQPPRVAKRLAERLGRVYFFTPESETVVVALDGESRARQWAAAQQHRSQHQPPPWPFELRLEAQEGREYFERLVPPEPPEPDRLLGLLGSV